MKRWVNIQSGGKELRYNIPPDGTYIHEDDYAALEAELATLRQSERALREAGTLLLEQYDAVPDFTMGGKLTNEPFMLMRTALAARQGGE